MSDFQNLKAVFALKAKKSLENKALSRVFFGLCFISFHDFINLAKR